MAIPKAHAHHKQRKPCYTYTSPQKTSCDWGFTGFRKKGGRIQQRAVQEPPGDTSSAKVCQRASQKQPMQETTQGLDTRWYPSHQRRPLPGYGGSRPGWPGSESHPPSFESPTDLDLQEEVVTCSQKGGGESARTMDACWPGKSWMSKCGNSKDVMSNVMPLSHTWIGNGDRCSKPGLVTRQARNSCRW